MTATATAPESVVAFLGPSLEVAEAKTLLPAASYQPPVRRGDLYDARNRGAALLLIVDGQFLQEEALPAREVIDVARDGALVYGAASMGALRAAECWPVGVRGVGLVYRLFRAGSLESDDEVAVATDADRGYTATTVALVTVRLAVGRARRLGLVDRRGANEIVERARRCFWPERTWPTILAGTGWAGHTELMAFCTSVDVKRDDAVALLGTVDAALVADPGLVERHRRSDNTTLLGPTQRQPLPDPLGGSPDVCQADLTRWLVGAGRARLDRHPVGFTPFGTWAPLKVEEPAFARWHWDLLAETGDLGAELMRMGAVDQAVGEAGRRGLCARAVDRYLAEAEIAARYRCASWAQLERLAGERGLPWTWIDDAARRLALAKRLRAELVR